MIRQKAMPSSSAREFSSPVNLATLYLGSSRHAIDGSNRIMLPSEWRGEGTPTRFFVLASDSDEFLKVCPPDVFEKFLADLRADTADKTRIPDYERELTEGVRQVSLDRFGRLPLPADFLTRVGIKGQGELVGRFSKFEIWAPDKYLAAQARRKQVPSPLSEKIQQL